MTSAESSGMTRLVLLVLSIPLVLLLVASLMVPLMMGGGMMGGMMGSGSFSPAWWIVPAVLALILGVVLWSALRANGAPVATPAPQLSQARAGPPAPLPAFSPISQPAGRDESFHRGQEDGALRLLEEDERRLYVLVRGRGGEMLQRDIVTAGVFSKPKVTRLLDKLEKKGLVTRERTGSTNRVRLTLVPDHS